MICVVDYDAGNLTSVETALRYLGAEFTVTADPDRVGSADRVIFPGVGEARHAMGVLKERHLDAALTQFAGTGKPLLGICLGCQILLEHSEERDTDLLGLIPGNVRLFPGEEGLKVPQIGWNTVRHDNSTLFRGIPQESSFYFVHSYFVETGPDVVATAEYGVPFAAAVRRENVWATQFHPEKSGPKGLTVLRNFLERIG